MSHYEPHIFSLALKSALLIFGHCSNGAGDGDVDGKKEEEVVVELTEEEQAVKEAARLEAVKPPPRVKCLVARGTMDISMCLNSMNDAQRLDY